MVWLKNDTEPGNIILPKNIMKKSTTTFVLSSLLLFTTCSKDEGYNSNDSTRGNSYSYSSSSYNSGGSSSAESTTSSSNTSSSDTSSSDSNNTNYSFTITAQNSSDYIVEGNDQNGNVSGNDPSISVKVGDTINLDINASGHPLFLIISSNGGFGSSNLVSGVSNNGAENGSITWSPSTVGTYYYICEYHSSMIGVITVTE